MLRFVHPTPSPWEEVPPPWRRCLELAWESLQEGSVPVGSVITDAAGAIVAEGRNRAFGDPPPPPGLGGSYIAHAEINALAGLPPGDYPDHTIWSSLEPCFMCSAAVFHSHLGTVRFAGRDPSVSGVERLPTINEWVESRWPMRHGPLRAPLGLLAATLPLIWHLQRSPNGVVARAHRTANPSLLALAEQAAAHPDATRSSLDATAGMLWPDLVSLAADGDGPREDE